MDGMKKAAAVLAPYLKGASTLPPQPTTTQSSDNEYRCAICHDLEWLHPLGPDGEPQYHLAVPCGCLIRAMQQRASSPEYQRQQGARPAAQKFDNYRVDLKGGNRDAYVATKAWAETTPFVWLLIYGGVGNGKSHLCNAALLTLLGRGVKAKLVTAAGILSALRRGIETHTTDDLMAEYQQMPTLIIDDLGAGMKHPSEKGSEWEWARMEELLVFRYENVMPTMFCTNLDLPDLPERIRSRFGDRELSRIVENKAEDYRGQK